MRGLNSVKRLVSGIAPLCMVFGIIAGSISFTASPAVAVPTCEGAEWRTVRETAPAWRFHPRTTGWPALECVMGRSSHSWGVVALQHAMIKCYRQNIALDGIYGPDTETSVRNVQAWENATRNAGLVVDGIAGPKTMKAMNWPLHWIDNLDWVGECKRP